MYSLNIKDFIKRCGFLQVLEDVLSEVVRDLGNNCLHCLRCVETSLGLVPPEILDRLVLEEELQVRVVWSWSKDLLHDTTGDLAVSWNCNAMRL